MLESIDLSASLPKKEAKKALQALQTRLFELQRACWRGDLGSVVVIEGWDTSGKGSLIRKLTERLEPRGYDLYYTREARSVDGQMPWLWRFWQQLPAYGRMAIYDQSWYSRLFRARAEYGADRDAWRRGVEDIGDFERMMVDDRYVVIKLFLHISRDEKERRLEALDDDPHECWKVTPRVRQSFKAWDEYATTIAETLAVTDSAPAPWTVLSATDKHWLRIRAFEAVIAALERALERHDLSPEALDEANDDEDADEKGAAS